MKSISRTFTGLLFTFFLMAFLTACSGGGGGSSSPSGNSGGGGSPGGGGSANLGMLAESVNFTGPYPAPGPVTYTNASGSTLTVNAFPGQVLVQFNSMGASVPSGTISTWESNIASNGGTIIGKIPLIGFYLVQVQSGKEGAFITAMLSGNYGVSYASPNGPISISQSAVPINPCYIEICPGATPMYVPLNVHSGVVVLDNFDTNMGNNPVTHGDLVTQAATAEGVTPSAQVDIPSDQNGSMPRNEYMATIIATIQGAAIYSPNQDVTINLSQNAPVNCGTDNAPTPCANDATYPARWLEDENDFVTTYSNAWSHLQPDEQSHILVTKSLGNGDQDITAAYHTLYTNMGSLGVQSNIRYVGASDTTPPNPRYPNGTYSNRVLDTLIDPTTGQPIALHEQIAWQAGAITFNGQTFWGTSFSAPRVGAVASQIASQFNTTITEADNALMQALIQNPNATVIQAVNAAGTIITNNGGHCNDPDADVYDDPDCD